MVIRARSCKDGCMTSWTVTVEENDQGEPIVPLPKEMLEILGWTEGDILQWQDNHNGSWSITKKLLIG